MGKATRWLICMAIAALGGWAIAQFVVLYEWADTLSR
jgi:hypothetical protein